MRAKRAEKGRKSTRADTVKRLPKLALGVATRCHLALSAWTGTGMGSDHPHFEPLLFDAWRRADVRVAAADAGFDSEANHRIGRLDMGVRTIIPPDIGRPTDKPPPTRFRRLMRQRFEQRVTLRRHP